MSDKKNKVENSKEFCRLYKTLAAAQAAAIDYVRKGATAKEMKQKANDVADVFQFMISGERFTGIIQNGIVNQPKKSLVLIGCEGGQCWDPIIEDCVDC